MHAWRDIFSKGILGALLRPYFHVETEREIVGHPQSSDLFVEPRPGQEPPQLGALERVVVHGPCLIEPFSQTPRPRALRACMQKQVNLDAEHARNAQRERRPEPPFPQLWVISPGRPTTVMQAAEFRPMGGCPPGFYASPGLAWYQFHIIVVHELPSTPETLPLRLLGRDSTFRTAIRELRALPDAVWPKLELAPVLVALRRQFPQDLTEDEEVMQALQEIDAIYEQWEKQVKDQGREEGRQVGREEGRQVGREEGRQDAQRAILFRLLGQRFGDLNDDVRRRIISADAEHLQQWTERVIPAATLDDVFK